MIAMLRYAEHRSRAPEAALEADERFSEVKLLEALEYTNKVFDEL